MPRPDTRPPEPTSWLRARVLWIFLLAPACGTAPQPIGIFRLQSSTAILESQGLHEVLVAAYLGDRIEGADALPDLEPGFRSMVASRAAADHPLLGLWQNRLAHLQSLALEPDANVLELAWVGAELPFRAALDDAVTTQVRGDPRRAASALDLGDRLPVSRSVRFRLLEIALKSPGIDDGRAARWMRSFLREGELHAARALALSPACGEAAACAGLAELLQVASVERAELFRLLAVHIADRPEHSALLVDSLAVLPRPDRGSAALHLLSLPGSSAALHLEITMRLGELSPADRVRLLLSMVRGPRFSGPVQAACLDAALALQGAAAQVVLEEISGSDHLEPETRERLIR